ncbi:TnsA-like heteromeric transposase endonuclease subunit [Acidipropionibacterium jensenii]|uniref:TnsA-like heteromeric transposase endonuclease subunit n=1 Tax=Acidipropionibacterium jensenii TaxID=1749 RepID=UPI00214C580B|nr:TnsA-like heteromeric transposase endonuclease subunit [Acidipropionibacterium jensenii]
MGRAQRRDVECTFLDAEGADHAAPLALVDPARVLRGRPVRAFPSHKALHHYPGWWWSSTMNDLVGYESLLERDCLMIADQDPGVRGIASQPFWLQGALEDGTPVRHVPDYLLAHRDGSWTVVDVKPADLAEQPEVGKVLSWTGKVAAERGWGYQVWSGAPSVRLGNLHFLAQGRRPHLVLPEIVTAIPQVARPHASLWSLQHEVADQGGWPAAEVRSALLCCLWFGTVAVDLDRPLTNASTVIAVRSAA